MKPIKLAAIAIVVIVVIVFLLPGRYEHSITFAGKELKHAESLDRNGLTSYFYTPTGGNPGEGDEFIQLIVFDEGASKEHRSAILDQTIRSFNLEPLDSDGVAYLGTMGGKGQEIHIYARNAPSYEHASIVLYVTAEDMDRSEAIDRADGLMDDLAGIQARLDKG